MCATSFPPHKNQWPSFIRTSPLPFKQWQVPYISCGGYLISKISLHQNLYPFNLFQCLFVVVIVSICLVLAVYSHYRVLTFKASNDVKEQTNNLSSFDITICSRFCRFPLFSPFLYLNDFFFVESTLQPQIMTTEAVSMLLGHLCVLGVAYMTLEQPPVYLQRRTSRIYKLWFNCLFVWWRR